jgi:DNA invertase Pin-like site-specific DNA recombinase
MKAYGYLRVSGSSQVEGDGFRRQEEEVRAYCKANGVELVKVFQEEAISGTNDETARPAFQEMITAILKNGVRTIIVEGLDRLAREYRIQETLLIYLASKRITLINARTGENVTEAISGDPMRKALIQIQGVFAELEKNMLVKKLRTAREAKKEETGKCEGRKSIEESDPALASLLRKLYRLPRNGKRMTLQRIIDILNRKGIKTISGREWTRANLHSALKSLSLR